MKKLLVVLMALLMLVGCGNTASKAPEAGTVEGNNYVMKNAFDITTLDYLYNNKSSNGDFTNNFVEGLLTQDRYGKLVEGMAKKWYSNDAADEWTFEIRDDAWWVTNNQEMYAKVTADDFVAGMQHAADSISETISLVKDLIKGLADYMDGTATWEEVGVKADGNKVIYTLTSPVPYFDSMTTYSILYPVNRDFLEASGEGCKLGAWDVSNCHFGEVDASKILYNSAYVLSELTAKSVLKMTYNKYYWDIKNVHVPEITVEYSEGTDPTENYYAFTRGEVAGSSINQSYADVVADAATRYADNQYLTDTDTTTFWGQFALNRRVWALYTDQTQGKSAKTTEAAREDTKKAILNANFRLAIFAAFDSVAYNAVTLGDLAEGPVRNTLTPWSFCVLSDGTSYGALVQKFVQEGRPEFANIDLTDGHDAWHSVENAKAFITAAKAELTDVTWPIHLDLSFNGASTNNAKAALAAKTSIEEALAGDVVIDLIEYKDAASYRASYYSNPTGDTTNFDLMFGAGWGPDYADPKTYLDVMNCRNGDMLQYSAINNADEGNQGEDDLAVIAAVGLDKYTAMLDEANAITNDNDARWTKYAEAEAYLLVNGLVRPFETSGANPAVSTVAPYSAAYGMYGAASYNQIPFFKYMIVTDHVITTEEHDTAKANWAAGTLDYE